MAAPLDDLQKAIESAKQFENFENVRTMLHLHPDWITLIPENRSWAILHHIVLSGNVEFLNQILALQGKNRNFDPLTKTKDGKTIVDIAQMRNDAPEMQQSIQRLTDIDAMLTHARECRWEECMKIVRADPTYLNQRTPYRRFYVIHHIACVGSEQVYEDFEKIPNCRFLCYLRAGDQTVLDVAIEHGHRGFADYLKKRYPMLVSDIEEHKLERRTVTTVEEKQRSEGISLMMIHTPFLNSLEDNIMPPESKKNLRTEVIKRIEENEIKGLRRAAAKQAASSELTATVSKQTSMIDSDMLKQTLICPLSLKYFTDPVIAADGCTYERAAIEEHMRTHDRSPVTNEKFANKELRKNVAIERILGVLNEELKKKK